MNKIKNRGIPIKSISQNKPKILFLCTYNSARSQMAEAFLRKLASDKYIVYSAGIKPLPINSCARKVMKDLGYDLSDHYPKSYTKYIRGKTVDIVITLSDRAEEKCKNIPEFKKRLYWSFEDPGPCKNTSIEEINKYKNTRNQILEKINKWLI